MKKIIVSILLILIPLNLLAAQGKLSGTVKDWLGVTITSASIKVYVFSLTGSGVSTQLVDQAYIAETTSSGGTWTISADPDIVLGTEYFIICIYGGAISGADGKLKSNLVSTEFQTAVAP